VDFLMATKVIMPKQGLQMTEGTITKWIIKEGDKVKEGTPLFEMETDKLTITIDSPGTGTLLKILRQEGETVPITKTIAVIGEPGEDIAGLLKEAGTGENEKADTNAKAPDENLKPETPEIKEEEPLKAKASGGRIFITPRAKMIAEEEGLNISDICGTGPDGLIIEKDVKEYVSSNGVCPKATPLARKVAQQSGIDLSDVEGTGAGGKITRTDVENLVQARAKNAGARSGRVIPFAGMRKVISQRMMESLQGMAQANHRMKVDMSEVIRFREKLKAEGIKVSFTDILVRIVSKALKDFPILNSSLTDEGILIKDYVNMGIAVAVENGLIVPVIKDADLLSLEEISAVSAELIDKAKSGTLNPDEYSGGSFTITNLGMFDIDEFTAIINPPESAILAIGKIDRVPVAEGDNVVIRPIMVLSLTYDHRIIDGAPAAKFLQRVKQIMQNPYLLI
jgi:pyruvate dehydrogenase E2 component (dihydrolipoamide acetyltransferase)